MTKQEIKAEFDKWHDEVMKMRIKFKEMFPDIPIEHKEESLYLEEYLINCTGELALLSIILS